MQKTQESDPTNASANASVHCRSTVGQRMGRCLILITCKVRRWCVGGAGLSENHTAPEYTVLSIVEPGGDQNKI